MSEEHRLPNRHENSVLEAESERYFRQSIPISWIIDKPTDFGIDLNITPVYGGDVIGLNFSVQLKSQKNVNGKWVARIKKSTLNYLFNRLEPTMIVLYDQFSGQARWLWLHLSDFDLSKNIQSYSVDFNPEQTISGIDWDSISSRVQQIFKVKNRLLTSLEYDLFNTQSEIEAKAWSHYYSQQLDEASFYFKRVVQMSDAPAICFLALAQCQYSMYDYRNALININKALELSKEDIILITKGCILAEDGIRNNDRRKLIEAEQIFRSLFNNQQTDVNAYNLANTIGKLGKLPEAEDLYKLALKRNPDYAEAWKNLGQIYYDMRRHDEEISCYDKAIAINPFLHQAIISKAITNGFVFRRYKYSIKTILGVINTDSRIFSEFPVIYYWLSFFYFQVKAFDESVEWINKGLNNNPGDPLLINLKANVLFDIAHREPEKLPIAIAFYSSLYEINSTDSVNYYYLCKCIQLQSGEIEALTMAAQWIKKHAITSGFQHFDENELSLEEALRILRHWEAINSYIITQNPVQRLQDQFYELDIYGTINFQNAFEIYRSVYLCHILELLSTTKSPKTIKRKTLSLFEEIILRRISEEIICGIVVAEKSQLSEFAKQVSAVIVTLSQVSLTEACRSFGFAVGYLERPDVENLIENIDPSFFSSAIYYYTEMFYRYFNLPVK